MPFSENFAPTFTQSKVATAELLDLGVASLSSLSIWIVDLLW